MFYSKAYREMTQVYPDQQKRSESKSVIEPKTISPEGWGQLFLLNEDGVILNAASKQKIEIKEILDGFLHHNKNLVDSVPKILSKTLNLISNNETILNFNPKNYGDYEFYILDLGKIEMYNGKFNLYPVFVPNELQRQRFRGGHLYAVAQKGLFEPQLFSFFYSDDPDKISPNYLADQALFYLKKSKGVKVDQKDFLDNYTIVYPYGKDYTVVLDFTKPNIESILNDVKNQVNKSENSVEIEDVEISGIPTAEKRSSQISIRPGKKIGLIVPFISKTEFTMVSIKEILNLKEIQNALKFRGGLGEIESVNISWILEEGQQSKVVKSSLKRGTKIKWKSKGGGLKEGKITSTGSFITPDVNLITSGVVPVRIDV
jgi:hypothetical protein